MNQQRSFNPLTWASNVVSPIVNARTPQDFMNIPGDMWEAVQHLHKPSENAARTAEMFGTPDRPSNPFSPAGSTSVSLPTSAAQVPTSVNTQGQVTGKITITVDQAGRVSAPQSIQLTGTQQSAAIGYGSSQMNNLSPSESYATPPLGGG